MLAFPFVLLALSTPVVFGAAARSPLPKISSLVLFGDSYTDPLSTGDRGTPWPAYVGGYSGLPIHNFAKSGATCSNLITPRPFPSILEDQLPAVQQSLKNGSLVVQKETTLVTVWIGTNDVGAGALLTGDQTPGVSIVNTTECAVGVLKTMYGMGFRNFLFQNMIPLSSTVLYSPTSYPNLFWVSPRNTTMWASTMDELVASGNALSSLLLSSLPSSLPGANIGLFDSHALFSDMIAHPSLYLNGTLPLNVTDPSTSCVFPLGGGTPACTTHLGAEADSFLWVDELHPGEQADRIVAREVTRAFNGSSEGGRWTTWFHR